jgi:hypothetical protein
MSQPLGQPQGNQQQGTGQAPPPQGPPQNGPPQQQPPPASPPQGQPPANGQQPQGQGQAPPQDVASLPDWAQALIRNTRDEAAQARTKAREDAAAAARSEIAQQIGAALGITPAGQAPDPAQLQTQIAQLTADRRRQDIENAAYRAANGLGANPDLLLDSNAFLANAHQLDPTAADFSTRLAAAVTSAVTSNPYLKAGTQPGAVTPPPTFAPNPAQQAGNGAPPPPASTVEAGKQLYQSKHQKSTA